RCSSVRGPPSGLSAAFAALPSIALASACGGVFVSPRLRSSPMAKRAARRAKLHAIDSARVHNLIFDHPPANDRDQSYLRKIRPRSDNQRLLMEAIDANPMTIAVGPAGTGKTYLAISAAVEALEAGSVSRIVLRRPAVEAGDNLGFLPGELREQLDP